MHIAASKQTLLTLGMSLGISLSSSVSPLPVLANDLLPLQAKEAPGLGSVKTTAATTNSGTSAASATPPDTVSGTELTPKWASGPDDSSPNPNLTPPADASDQSEPPPKILYQPGVPISVNTNTEDVAPTDDVDLARKQADAYPDSPEAAFIYAVALTRTSRVEDALRQVRHAKHLAEAQGGGAYFDHMIKTYEHMLEYEPNDNHARYTLAWAYYMKAYLLARTSPPEPPTAAQALAAAAQGQANSAPSAPKGSPGYVKPKNVNADLANQVLSALSPQLAVQTPAEGKVSTAQLPHIQGALELAPPGTVPQVKQYCEAALKNLDDLLAQKPDDIWARIYRAHLNAEFTGDVADAIKVYRHCQEQAPQNPAPYFFLGEAYLRVGNLKECLNNVSKAIALRALGM